MGCCVSIGRVINLNDAIHFAPISVCVGENNIDITGECQFSWSQDKLTWSCWNTYENYINICSCIEGDFYLRILFKNNLSPKLYINNVSTLCFTIGLYDGNPFLEDPCQILNQNGFDIYSGWDCALLMQQQLSDQIICMYGIPVYYFKVTPDTDTKSYTFKEYVLHNVQSVKQIKMMITDGQMPSSKPTLSEWDFEFETDWETELSKTQFATAFGLDAFPKQRDFVWVPMQKRMYMVNSAYEEKNEGFMWRATTWKLALIKYQDQSNIDDSSVEEILDSLVVNKYSDVFETGERREGELTAEPQLVDRVASNNLYSLEDSDYIRKQITKDVVKIVDRQINHGNIIVSKNKYIFNEREDEPSIVTYQKGWCGDSGTLSLIFDFNHCFDEKRRTILAIGQYKIDFQGKITKSGKEIKETGSIILPDNSTIEGIDNDSTYLLVMRWGRNTNDISLNLFKHVAPVGIPSYKMKPTMLKFDFNNPLSVSTVLDGRLISEAPLAVVLSGYPLQICNLKLYNKYVQDDCLDEILKYTTKDEYCVINDQARPLNDSLGFSVR